MGTSSAWTPERRAKQSERINKSKPWEKSTGPKTEAGKAISSQNARMREDLRELRAKLYQARPFLRGLEEANRAMKRSPSDETLAHIELWTLSTR